MFDIIIVGGGPAGLTAAIYARRAGKSVLVIEKESFGGQMNHSPKIENYPGYPEISGLELSDKMFEHALGLGAEIEIDEVTSVTPGEIKKVKTENSEFECKALIIAAGVKHRVLNVPGEAELIGNGISFCAVCDGAFYADKSVCVIGGGNSAMQEAIMLSERCRRVTMIQDMPYLTGEKVLADIIESRENIDVIYNSRVVSFNGDGAFETVTVIHGGKTDTLEFDGCFTAIGLIPGNGMLEGVTALDKYGYISANNDCETESPGIYAAGDCRTKRVRQIATAVSDGAAAALAACRYIDGR